MNSGRIAKMYNSDLKPQKVYDTRHKGQKHVSELFKDEDDTSVVSALKSKHLHGLEDLIDHTDSIVSIEACTSKTFQGIPTEWHRTIKVRNPHT